MRIEEPLRDIAVRHGEHPAIVAQRICHSFGELDLKAERLAAALQGGGVRRGDRVAVFLDDGWEAVVSVFAVSKAGGVVMAIGAGTPARVLDDILKGGQPVAVITQSRLAARVAAAIAAIWSIRLIVLAGGDRNRTGGTCISFETTVARIGRVPTLAPAGEDSDAAVQFGSEEPLTHRQIWQMAAGFVPSDGPIVLPTLTERGGFARMLSVVGSGRMMMVRSAMEHGADGVRRNADMGLGRASLDRRRPFDSTRVGATPVFQR